MMSPRTDAVLRYTVLFVILACGITGLLILAGCTGAYRMREPLGPVKTDRLPVCDHAAIPKTCERT